MSPFQNVHRTSVRGAGERRATRSVSVAPDSSGGTREGRTTVVEPVSIDVVHVHRRPPDPTVDRGTSHGRMSPGRSGFGRTRAGVAGAGSGRRPAWVLAGGFGHRTRPDRKARQRSATDREVRCRGAHLVRREGGTGRGATGTRRFFKVTRARSDDGRSRGPAARGPGVRSRFGVTGTGRQRFGAAGPARATSESLPCRPDGSAAQAASFGEPAATAARRGRETGTRTPRHGNHCTRVQQGRGRVGVPPAGSNRDGAPEGRRVRPQALRSMGAARVHRKADGQAQPAAPRASASGGEGGGWTASEGTRTTDEPTTAFRRRGRGETGSPGPKGRRNDLRQAARRFGAARSAGGNGRCPRVFCRHEFLGHRKIEGKVGARRRKSTERLVNGRGPTGPRASARGTARARRSETSSADRLGERSSGSTACFGTPEQKDGGSSVA
jgi:hypothetical protein